MNDCGGDCSSSSSGAAAAIASRMAPNWYSSRLRTFIDLTAADHPNGPNQSQPKPVHTAIQLLHRLEGELRTARDNWVDSFLRKPKFEFAGLSILVRFLIARLHALREEHHHNNNNNANEQLISQIGEDEVYQCLLCLKAIMLRPFGFELVVAKKEEKEEMMKRGEQGQSTATTKALFAIALSLAQPHTDLRVKSLALELLAATCLMGGGCHRLVLAAFQLVQKALLEKRRFQSLVLCFTTTSSDARFSVACMQFINILVNASPRLLPRIRLQKEFKELGLEEDYLKRRMSGGGGGDCNDALQGQIQAYLGNLLVGDSLKHWQEKCEQETAQAKVALSLANRAEQEAWSAVESGRRKKRDSKRLERAARECNLQSLEAQAAYITALARLKRVEQAIEEEEEVEGGK